MQLDQLVAFVRDSSLSVQILGAASIVYVVYSILSSLITAQRRASLARQRGCQPCPSYKHIEPFYGIDIAMDSMKAVKAGVLMESIGQRFQRTAGGCTTFTSLSNGRRVVNTIDPENIKAILSTQFKEFALPSRRIKAFVPLLGEGIFTTNGAAWEHSRALLRPNFARTQVADLDTFEEHITKLIRKIPTDGSSVDLQKLFFMLTIDSATEFLFGESTDTLDEKVSNEEADRFADAFNASQDAVGNHARLGFLSFLMGDKKFKEDKEYVHQFVDQYVAKAAAYRNQISEKQAEEEGNAGRYVFLQELAKTNANERQMRNELLNILLAGRDTTASLLSHLWFTLARRPEIFEKLRAEVEQLGNDRPTFETIKDMKYLRYCVNEALRLYPVVPANSREAVRDTTLPVGGGPDGKSPILVKKGQFCMYYVYTMHRRKDLYGDDAEEFKPERWEKLRPGWEYLPFNGGPRICLGQQFALTEASYTTIRLLQAFKKVRPTDSSEWKEQLTLTMAVQSGVNVSLTPA